MMLCNSQIYKMEGNLSFILDFLLWKKPVYLLRRCVTDTENISA